MAIVVGLDQHRAQITAEWIDTDTGEIGRARVSPAHRGDVRKFFKRFAGQRLEVALEATTGWRFVVEELHAIGAAADLAEPAETAARRGNKKRAKTDRADARHLRELLMIGRLPESWIAPDHLLDLRAKVRLRHTLVDQRGEWQQRIPGRALPPWLPPAPRPADRREPRLAGEPEAPRQRARTDRRRACDDRRARRSVGAPHARAAALRAPPGRHSCATTASAS
jgi:transposase